MTHILCKIFGHKITDLNVHRRFAHCARCDKSLKVSYDMAYGDTIVEGDYGDQKTFCWCDCGNELISSGSFNELVLDCDYEFSAKKTVPVEVYLDFEKAKCRTCGKHSLWDFGAPAPLLVEQEK